MKKRRKTSCDVVLLSEWSAKWADKNVVFFCTKKSGRLDKLHCYYFPGFLLTSCLLLWYGLVRWWFHTATVALFSALHISVLLLITCLKLISCYLFISFCWKVAREKGDDRLSLLTVTLLFTTYSHYRDDYYVHKLLSWHENVYIAVRSLWICIISTKWLLLETILFANTLET